MTIGEKLAKIRQNVSLVFQSGKTLGRKEEGAVCAARHFTALAEGDGTTALRFYLPFEPDVLTVWGADPRIYKKANRVAYFSADLASFSYVSAVFGVYNTAGTVSTTGMTADTVLTRYSRDADGMVTLQNMKANQSAADNFFGSGVPYVIHGAKYTDKTYRERITRLVESLDDAGGTIMLNKTKVCGAFTDAEWDALTQIKPGWTFTLI